LSDATIAHRASPAVALWEFSSIAEGVFVADAIAKGAPVSSLSTGTVHPGKYLVLASGDTASVGVAIDIVLDAGPGSLIDAMFLPDIAESVAHAVVSVGRNAGTTADAVGIVETESVASAIEAADAAVKDADVSLAALRLADGLGGKAFFIVEGSVGDVESSVAAAVDRCGDRWVKTAVIPQLTPEIRADLASSSRFKETIVTEAEGSA
jgi:microcompartment protein CcmL/EutN